MKKNNLVRICSPKTLNFKEKEGGKYVKVYCPTSYLYKKSRPFCFLVQNPWICFKCPPYCSVFLSVIPFPYFPLSSVLLQHYLYKITHSCYVDKLLSGRCNMISYDEREPAALPFLTNLLFFILFFTWLM